MELWTPEHVRTLLPALAAMVVVSFLMRLWLLKKPHWVRMIPLKIISVVLVVLETGKQATSFSRGYDLYCLPFHFCSLFIFVMPVMAFYGGKHRQKVYGIAAALCAALTLLMLIYPNLIYSAGNIKAYSEDFMSLHTVAFHNLVMFGFLLMLTLDIQQETMPGENRRIVVFVLGFCAVSASMAHLLKTNYANFYTCNIPVFEAIRTGLIPVVGSVVTQLIYVLILCVLNVAFVLGSYWFYRLLRCRLHPVKRVAP